MQQFFQLLDSARNNKVNIARKMDLILSVIDRDEQFVELRARPMFIQTRHLYARVLDILSRQATTDWFKTAQLMSSEADAVLDLIHQYITFRVITNVPMAHEIMGPLFDTKPEAAMKNSNLPLASGDTLIAKAEMACSFAALGEGNWSEWRFGDHTGLIYATDAYCVFFNANGVAFTGSFSVFANTRYKTMFMEVATMLHAKQKDLGPLFEHMDELVIGDDGCTLDADTLNVFYLNR